MRVSLERAKVNEVDLSALKEEEQKTRFSVKETVFFLLLLISFIIYCITIYAFLKHGGYKPLLINMCSAFFTLLLAIITYGLLWDGDKKRDKIDTLFYAVGLQERLSNLTDLNLTDGTIFGVNSNGNVEQFSVDTDFVNNYVKDSTLDFSAITKESLEEAVRE